MYRVGDKSIIEKIKYERGARFELLTIGDAEGNKNWLYLYITEKDFSEMKKIMDAGGKFNPEDFGVVYMQGIGESPPEELDTALKDFFKEKWIEN